MKPDFRLPCAVLASVALSGCSAGGGSEPLTVGREGSGGKSGAGGAPRFVSEPDSKGSTVLSAHIESPPGVTVEFVTLSCANRCAEVLAVANGGFAPYSYTWEDGSRDPARHVCPGETTEYLVTVEDTAQSSPEFRYERHRVQVPLTAEVIACPPDGGVVPPESDGGPIPPESDGGSCFTPAPLEELTPDVLGTPAYFSGGASLPPGKYRIAYVDGCMKYDQFWSWTVQGLDNSPPLNFMYMLIGASTSDVLGVLPGTAAPISVTGYPTYDACVAANRALPPLDFDFAGGKLGIWQNDWKPDDNTAGARAPTWLLSRMDPCP